MFLTRPNDPAENYPALSEDGFLLAEAVERTAGEVAAALAALQLARAAIGSVRRNSVLDEAISRLEGFAAAHDLLRPRPALRVNVAQDLEGLCRALSKGRHGADGSEIRLELPEVWIDGAASRRLLLIAADLISRSIRDSLVTRVGTLLVSLRPGRRSVSLLVSDDAPVDCDEATGGNLNYRLPLVTTLVRRAGGALVCKQSDAGTLFRITLPVMPLPSKARAR